MSSIGEAELVDFVKNGAVKQLNIIKTKSGRFSIAVVLTWKDGIWELVTSRKTPREWVSLDRLILHIEHKYEGKLPPITLTLT